MAAVTPPRGITFDTGALIAIEKRDQHISHVAVAARKKSVPIRVPAPILVEWWRGSGQANSKVILAFDIEAVDKRVALLAGAALGMVSERPSALDAIVMATASLRGDIVYTDDFDDLQELGEAAFPGVLVLKVGG